MRRARNALLVGAVLLLPAALFAQAGTCAGMSTGQLSSLNGFVPFPANNLWNTDISALAVDVNSANIISFIGSSVTLHPDFGSGTYQKQTIGISLPGRGHAVAGHGECEARPLRKRKRSGTYAHSVERADRGISQ